MDIGEINDGIGVEESQSSLRQNRDEVFQATRGASIEGVMRIMGALSLGAAIIFPMFWASDCLFPLQYAEGFNVPKNRGRLKTMRQIRKRSLPSKTLRLDVIPLESGGDEVSVVDAVYSSKDNVTDTTGTNSVIDGMTANNSNISSQLLSSFNASESIGSLLIQMQRKEAELRLLNQSSSQLLSEDQTLKLDPNNSATRSVADQLTMYDGIARELDDSVTIRITNSVKDITILDLPERNQFDTKTEKIDTTMLAREKKNNVDAGAEEQGGVKGKSKTSSTSSFDLSDDNLPSLSRAEHYDGRIGRDMRHLAISIASCISSVEEWQLFCQQSTGGLEPLIECIREGAESIRGGNPSSKLSTGLDDHHSAGDTHEIGQILREENFQIASSACRVLRDLCALSLDLAAVITDGLLRANSAYKNKGIHTLMDDFCLILDQANDFLDIPHRKSERKNLIRRSTRRIFRRRNKSKAGFKTAQSGVDSVPPSSKSMSVSKWPGGKFRARRDARLRSKLYVTQLLLAMTCASDAAVEAIRSTDGLKDVLHKHSSYAQKERRRRWMRYPGEKIKSMLIARRKVGQKLESETSTQKPIKKRRQPFIEAASLQNNINGKIQGTANQVLAAIGYNEWVPKTPGQKGLRILCLDGGGSRGMTSVMAMKCLVDHIKMEVGDAFDMIAGTSTGAIIAFLVGLNLESSEQAVERYDVLIEKIFTKSAFSAPMLLFTTASYDESTFMNVLTDILGDNSMLDTRANPAVPFVFAVTSKMSSTPTHVALFRNYNYNGGELPDPFLLSPDTARENLELLLKDEAKTIKEGTYPKKREIIQPAPGTVTPGSRHPGSFRVLQKYALRASTAAPTVFKPVEMGGEIYCDGGVVASNPSAIAIHEARTIFPDVPIELVVSIGTGGFKEVKSEPRIGWDGIIGQIVNSATDGEQIHHILEDILGDGTTAHGKLSTSNISYMRFNPTLGTPDEFPIDVTDPDKLQQIKRITRTYMKEPEQQRKLEILSDILKGQSTNRFRRWFRR